MVTENKYGCKLTFIILANSFMNIIKASLDTTAGRSLTKWITNLSGIVTGARVIITRLVLLRIIMNGMKSFFSLRAYANGLFGAVRLDDNCVFFLTPDEHLATKVFEYINKYYQAEINATDIAFCGLERISINDYIRIRLKCILEVREITLKHISNVSGFQYSSLIRFLEDRQYDSRVEALYKTLSRQKF
jgi:hypothetical protein